MKHAWRVTTILIAAAVVLYCCTKAVLPDDAEPALTVKDSDGNIYGTVRIGKQTWMAENLKVTRYNNGDPILEIKDKQMWRSSITGARTVYDNFDWKAGDYGLLYNWHAVSDPRGICPPGWRVPNDQDWKELEEYLHKSGDPDSTEMALKTGGKRNTLGTFFYEKENGYFWTATSNDLQSAYCRIFHLKTKRFERTTGFLNEGMSIRLIKD